MRSTAKMSIVPRAADRDRKLAAAFTDFEGRLCNLNCMAELTLWTVTDLDGAAPPSDQQINLAIFSVRHLSEMIDDAKAEWYRQWRAAGNDADA